MDNILRTLVLDNQISLTLADTTAIVKEGIILHELSGASALVFGKALSAMVFMSSCLKSDKGEISLSVQTDGDGKNIGVSGNRKLFIRGYIAGTDSMPNANESQVWGTNGSLTIIRDDGYIRPFVGTCALKENGSVDESFEEYYRISEQLPTYLKTAVEFDETGELVFAGTAVLQPLPFASQDALRKTQETDLGLLLKALQEKGIDDGVQAFFETDKTVWEKREAKYQCNCSREYLTIVLITLGKQQMHKIIEEDGAVRIHCHYCNKDYQFTQEDEQRIFP